VKSERFVGAIGSVNGSLIL